MKGRPYLSSQCFWKGKSFAFKICLPYRNQSIPPLPFRLVNLPVLEVNFHVGLGPGRFLSIFRRRIPFSSSHSSFRRASLASFQILSSAEAAFFSSFVSFSLT